MGKNLLKLLMTNSLLILILAATGQDNIIKTSISGYLLGDFSLSFERQTYENQSIQLRFGYFQPTLSPFISEKTLTPSEYTFVDSKGSPQASIEYRFYTKREGLTGFYLGPYFRYYSINADYTDVIKENTFNVDGSINSFGLGVQLGYNWIINDIVSIDFSFFGAGIDKNTVKLIYTHNSAGFDYNTIVNDVNEVFKDVRYLEKRLKNEVSADNLTTKIPFLFPGLKAGVTIGIVF